MNWWETKEHEKKIHELMRIARKRIHASIEEILFKNYKMKTAKEWFKELPISIVGLAFENTKPEFLELKYNDLADALKGSFVWGNTPQGEVFWEGEFNRSVLDNWHGRPKPTNPLPPHPIFVMNLHEAWKDNKTDLVVVRVPGGWLYSMKQQDHPFTFVPYSNDFNPPHIP